MGATETNRANNSSLCEHSDDDENRRKLFYRFIRIYSFARAFVRRMVGWFVTYTPAVQRGRKFCVNILNDSMHTHTSNTRLGLFKILKSVEFEIELVILNRQRPVLFFGAVAECVGRA